MERKRCYGCMQVKDTGPVCEHCGYDERLPSPAHHLPPGTILKGQYLIGKCLGQGGFGITYLGWDIFLKSTIAVKEYYPTGIVTREASYSYHVTVCSSKDVKCFEENRTRFLREAQTLSKLENVPEVVHIRNFFPENNTAYIVMEYVKGIRFSEYIRNMGGRLNLAESISILEPLMGALEQVHALGLVHRDISPDNIIVQPNGQVRLIDFGAAHEATHSTDAEIKSTQAILKHGFAPIEQYQRRGNLGPWTDVYGICATIYYALTGKTPPHATDRLMCVEDFQWNNIPGLTDMQIHVLERGLALDYTSRIQSVAELRQELSRSVSRVKTEENYTDTQGHKEIDHQSKLSKRLIPFLGMTFVILVAALFFNQKQNLITNPPSPSITATTTPYIDISEPTAPNDPQESTNGNALSYLQPGDIFTFGVYEQDNLGNNGEEAIEWLVLEKENDKIFVISLYAIENMPYSASDSDTTWGTSYVREWLNNSFYNSAFSASEKKSILTTYVLADKNEEYPDVSAGSNTEDKLFLLSIEEIKLYLTPVQNSGESASDYTERRREARTCEPTQHVIGQGAYVRKSNNGSWWMLRTPGDSPNKVSCIVSYGDISYDGANVASDKGTVRPAMWISID